MGINKPTISASVCSILEALARHFHASKEAVIAKMDILDQTDESYARLYAAWLRLPRELQRADLCTIDWIGGSK